MTSVNISHVEWATNNCHGLYGGKSEWRDNKFIESSSYIGDGSKEVIPVFAANRMTPWRPGNSWHLHYNGLESRIDLLGEENFIIRKYDSIEGEYSGDKRLDGLIGSRLRAAFSTHMNSYLARKNKSRGYAYRTDISEVPDEVMGTLIIDAIEEVRKDFMDNIGSSMDYGLPESNSSTGYGWSQYWRYKELMGHFLGGSGWAIHHTRTYINNNVVKYLVGSTFLADVSSTSSGYTEINPLICLVTKPEYMEYIRWAIALGKEVDHRVLQIWIHPEFDIPRSRWRGLRPYMRKHFLIPMYDAGVPVVEKESFKELFKNYNPPKLNNIRDYRKWLMDCSIESINNIKSNLK